MDKVFLENDVQLYLQELSETLYQENYFYTEEKALDYIRRLILKIVSTLPLTPHRLAPHHFHRYGYFYAMFRISRNTCWYAFFTAHKKDDDTIYIVRYITNNHKDGKYLT